MTEPFRVAVTVDDLPMEPLPAALEVLARFDSAGARFVTLADPQRDPACAAAGGGT